MRAIRHLAAMAVLGTLLLVAPATARAETTATSTITQIKMVEKSHANYRLFHGAIWLDYDKATQNYRWGGAHCKNQGVGELNLSLLFAAFRSKFSVNIDYKVMSYQDREYRCITGFSVTR
ncbi:MAG TPA: hypothetical protein VML75_24705 [Kofleriaceae bacterium]|nr:hypothetical protein [Kofleriaceae bacterium]